MAKALQETVVWLLEIFQGSQMLNPKASHFFKIQRAIIVHVTIIYIKTNVWHVWWLLGEEINKKIIQACNN